jgi:hypothetical protein
VPRFAASSASWPRARESGAGSRRTSCGTRTPSSWPGESVPLNIIERQLGHVNLGTTSIYLQGIDPEEIIGSLVVKPDRGVVDLPVHLVRA